MHSFRRWWNSPSNYVWTTAYHRSDSVLRHVHTAIGAWCWLYAVLCVLATHTPAGVSDGVGRLAAYVLAGTTTIVGVAWVRGPFPTVTVSWMYVVYLEITAAIGLLMLADPYIALPCASALGVIGGYIAAFHSPKLFLTHQVWAQMIVAVLFARAVTSPGSDVALACVYLVLVVLVLFSAPILTQSLLVLLRRDAATAFFDPLTGLRNRRGLDAALLDFTQRSGLASIMVIDHDNFKSINDRYGHAHGDAVLRSTANAISDIFPPPAVTARTGGEEFVVLTHADPMEAVGHAQALRRRVATMADAVATVSIGIAHTDTHALDHRFQRAYGEADNAMYSAKSAGGNSIHIYDPAHVNLGPNDLVDE